MKKIFLSLFCLIMMTGCTATYRITIKDDVIKEHFEVLEPKNKAQTYKDELGQTFQDYAKKYGEDNKVLTSFYDLYSDSKCENNCSYYEKKYIGNDNIGFSLSNKFIFSDYKDSTIANELLPGFSSEFDGRYLKISGGNSWNFIKGYDNLDHLKIIIETDYKVISFNGNKDGSTYTWDIYKDKTDEVKSLYMIIDTKTENNKFNLIALLIVLGGIIAFAVIIGLILYKKNRAENVI